MIISYYGKKFLNKYNEIEGKSLTPKDFFVKVFYPIFFMENKALIHVQNSPFNNPSNKKKKLTEKYDVFFEKINKGKIDASIFVGGYADGLTSTTSFNLAGDYNHLIDENEIFYSWIGQALSIKMGGIDFLFDNENLLYDIYLGWKRYFELLSNPIYVDFKGNQISTWNANWITNEYQPYPNKKFNPFDVEKNELKSVSWVKLLFYISKKYPTTNLNAYAYKLGQTNETYGNIVIETETYDTYIKYCESYFEDNDFLNNNKDAIESILGTTYGMEKICEFGSIGYAAIKPKLLKYEEQRIKSNKDKKIINKLYKDITTNNSNHKLYNTYIMAILNLKNIEKDIIEIAETLYYFQYDSRKNVRVVIDNLLTDPSNFIKNMSELMKICAEEGLRKHADVFNKFVSLGISNETNLSKILYFIKYQLYYIETKKRNKIL